MEFGNFLQKTVEHNYKYIDRHYNSNSYWPPWKSFTASARASIDSMSRLFVGSSWTHKHYSHCLICSSSSPHHNCIELSSMNSRLQDILETNVTMYVYATFLQFRCNQGHSHQVLSGPVTLLSATLPSLSLPLLFPPPLPFPLPSLPLEVGPLNTARESGGAL